MDSCSRLPDIPGESGLTLRCGPGDVEVFPDPVDVIIGPSDPYRALVHLRATARSASDAAKGEADRTDVVVAYHVVHRTCCVVPH